MVMGEPRAEAPPPLVDRFRRATRFVIKRVTGLYYREIIGNQRDILRQQRELAGQLHALGANVAPPERLAQAMPQFTRTLGEAGGPRPAVYLGEHRILTRTVFGHKILVDSRDKTIGWHLVLDGYWEPAITEIFLREIKEGMTVIDIGAHIGYYTLLACSLVGSRGKVISFEPDARNFDALDSGVHVNGFRDRCECHNLAVTHSRGRQAFYSKESEPGGNTLWPEPDLEGRLPGQVTSREVETISLDEFLASRPGVRPDIVKIDAEGSEALIIEGMKRTMSENSQITLVCEFCPDRIRFAGGDPAATLRIFDELGFVLKHVQPDATISLLSASSALASQELMLLLRRS